MKVTIGPVQISSDYHPEKTGWILVKEPSPWMMQIISLPFGLFTGYILLFLWNRTTPDWPAMPGLLSFILLIIATLIFHELAHLIVHPGKGLTSNSVLGVWLSRSLFYCHYNGEISRDRFVATLLSPFILLSLMPLAVTILTGRSTFAAPFVSILNGILCCADILSAVLLLRTVPQRALLRNHGWQSYYRLRV